jgi:proline iminopeptidase
MSEPSPLRPFDARMICVGDGHWIYVEEVGLKGGRPCVFLHGGPGSGSQYGHRALFDPERDHVFLLDQRGAGRSHPYLSREANTTPNLVRDIEVIREHFGIKKWLVVGGSWGSTLGLAYAEQYPERVTGMVLRAIFLGTDAEVEWAFVDGPKKLRPDQFKAFRDFLPEDERGDPLAVYIRRLNDADPAIHAPAAQMWNAFERALSEVRLADAVLPDVFAKDARLAPTPIMEAHYIANHFFLEPGQLLANAHRLHGIPGALIQGRHDILCPPENAQALAKAWPDAHLQIIEKAGHATTEPGITEAMRAAISVLNLDKTRA